MIYLDADSFDGQQEGIEWMKAGDLHELLLLLIWYAWLDSLQQGMGLEKRDREAFYKFGTERTETTKYVKILFSFTSCITTTYTNNISHNKCHMEHEENLKKTPPCTSALSVCPQKPRFPMSKKKSCGSIWTLNYSSNEQLSCMS